jgi:AraC-like DNA-binding protein
LPTESAEVATMRDLTQLPMLTPEVLLGSGPLPPPCGPMRFALPDWDERAQPTLVRECFARMGLLYDIERLPDVPFLIDLSLNALPGLLMGTGRIHGSRNRRTRAHVEDDTDDIGLIVNLRGPHLIEQRDQELVLGDGEAVFVSLSDPSCFTHKPPGDMLVFRFPRAKLAPLAKAISERCMQRIPSDVPALRFLRSYVGIAWDKQMTAAPELQQLVVDHLYDLMALTIGAAQDAAQTAQGRGLRAARLRAIKQDIARNLDQSDLSVATLAKRHGCTPRFVQRLFEAEGTTFTEYVLAQRLARAHRLLIDPRREHDKISVVAYDSGFGDVSYFNRMFRRHYGAAPSDIRAQARQHVPKTVEHTSKTLM